MEHAIKMPQFDKSLLIGIKGLDEIIPLLPRYKVTFKNPVFSLPFKAKAKICVYAGYWHSLDGWNYKDEEIESYEYIGEYDDSCNPIKFPDKPYPYRAGCMRHCDICFGSVECLRRRGAEYDEEKGVFITNSKGNLVSTGHRSCDKGINGMSYIREE